MSSVSTPSILCEPHREPSEIRAGDTVIWRRHFEEFPASAGFTLAYAFVNRTAAYQLAGDLVSADGNLFQVNIPAATTAVWTPGQYRWQAFIAGIDGFRKTVGEGMVKVLPNLQAVPASGLDERERDERILDAIRDLLEGKVLAGDAQRYTIDGRELTRYTFAELEKLRGLYARRVRELRVQRGERVTSRTVRTGFLG